MALWGTMDSRCETWKGTRDEGTTKSCAVLARRRMCHTYTCTSKSLTGGEALDLRGGPAPTHPLRKARRNFAKGYENSWEARVSADPSAKAIHNNRHQELCNDFGAPKPFIESLLKGMFSERPPPKSKVVPMDFIQKNKVRAAVRKAWTASPSKGPRAWIPPAASPAKFS
eukprot:RCo029684